MKWLGLIRFPNLIIVALTQGIIFFQLYLTAKNEDFSTFLLSNTNLILLIFTTILIAATGYIINDIVDYEIDVINKPEKLFINRIISEPNAWHLYWGLVGIGMLISIYIAFQTNTFRLIWIYPLAILLLYLYSTKFKKEAFIGNLIVSLFCAFVPGIILIAEYEIWQSIAHTHFYHLTIAYLIFAFFSTIFREIVKDLEDQEGDSRQNCRTLPIILGENIARWIGVSFGLILLIALLFWLLKVEIFTTIGQQIFYYLGLLSLMIYLIIRLIFAKSKQDYHHISTFTKLLMLNGLIYLALF